MTPVVKPTKEPRKETRSGNGENVANPMLLALTTGRHPAVLEMGILGTILPDTIIDRGSGVNVLPKETWK